MAIRDIYHDAETIARYVRSGEWANATLDDHLQHHARERGDKLAIVDRRWRLTFADSTGWPTASPAASCTWASASGDVISIQLPNWAEWLIAHCAATKIGAVTNSIGAVYRDTRSRLHPGLRRDGADGDPRRVPRLLVYRHAGRALARAPRACARSLVVGDACPPGMRSFADLSTRRGRSATRPRISRRSARIRTGSPRSCSRPAPRRIRRA